MLVRMGVNMDLHPIMRMVLREAERIYIEMANREAIVTSARDREHSAGSWHYYGLAVDFRIMDLEAEDVQKIFVKLKDSLPGFDVILESTHIHVEIGNSRAASLSLL